jgi:cytidylate kinase
MPSIDDIINRQFRQWEMQKIQREEAPPSAEPPMEIVTISRESGSRGSYFAELLAEKLGYQLVHKEMVDAISETSGYRKRIIESLDQQYRSRLELMVQSFLTGQAVDHSDYTRHMVSVVLSMARLGGVIMVGRGGNFILGPDRGFHIRFVCPKEQRIQNLINYCDLSEVEAAEAIEHSDTERGGLMRKVFGADINDPHHYDAVINSAYIDIVGLVKPTIAAIRLKLTRLAQPLSQNS